MKPIFKNEKTAFVWLCAAVYFVSYLTRNSYSSLIPEIKEALNLSEDAIGLVGTSAFLTYGAGQIICGILADRYSPRYVLFTGILLTTVCNLLMPFICGDTLNTVILWGVNGLAQAMFWPPLVRLMSERLEKEDFDKAVVTVTTASAIGNIVLYTLSPISVAYMGWKPVFFVVGAISAVTSVVWLSKTKGAHRTKEDDFRDADASSNKANAAKLVFSSGMPLILFAILLMGVLRDGLATWMPSLVADEYNLSNSVSIFSAVLLPAFAIIGIKAASALQNKIKNELFSSALIFGFTLACTAILLIVFHSSVFISVAIMSLITAAMHGVNLMLISRVPRHYARFGKISTISGILNAFTYIGAAASSYGFASFSARYGWYFIIGSWAVIAFVGTAVCLLVCKRWKRFIV